MKKTSVDGTIAKLFEARASFLSGVIDNHWMQGKSEMFVECLGVDYKSSREETFHDLALNVKARQSRSRLASFTVIRHSSHTHRACRV